MRDQISSSMKEALKAGDKLALSTTRLIAAALKDRDITARGNGVADGISDDEILSMLQTMIKQRRESITMFRDAGREEMAQDEEKEIAIIQGSLPEPLTDDEASKAIDAAIASTQASSVKDMGKVMAYLKQQHAGTMDFSKVSQMIKTVLLELSSD